MCSRVNIPAQHTAPTRQESATAMRLARMTTRNRSRDQAASRKITAELLPPRTERLLQRELGAAAGPRDALVYA
jgi:hypothetical protein